MRRIPCWFGCDHLEARAGANPRPANSCGCPRSPGWGYRNPARPAAAARYASSGCNAGAAVLPSLRAPYASPPPPQRSTSPERSRIRLLTCGESCVCPRSSQFLFTRRILSTTPNRPELPAGIVSPGYGSLRTSRSDNRLGRSISAIMVLSCVTSPERKSVVAPCAVRGTF